MSRTLSSLVCCLLVSACGGGSEPPPPVVSLSGGSMATVQESRNPTVQINVAVSSTAHAGLAIPLEFSGSATRDHDYTVSSDSIIVPPNARSSGIAINVFRDFDLEGDETIEVTLGPIKGNAQAGAASSFTVNILDGEAAAVDKMREQSAGEGLVTPAFFAVTEAAVDFVVLAFTFPDEDAPSIQLVAEWSSDAGFATDVNLLGVFDIPVFDFDTMVFLPPYAFSLPLNNLAANESYFVRVYLASAMRGAGDGPDGEGDGIFQFSFATNPEGRVVTRCEAPDRSGGFGGSDPLFAEQWHLSNTGQSGFSRNRGVPGADLQMSKAIREGQNGSGIRLAVVDTGLEICHPDLAANVEPGQSFNFLFAGSAGSSPADPFNLDVLGDHGTSVAGVAAAVANNGLGGRGVAPGVALRGYNAGSFFADPQLSLLQSLGGSRSYPDSQSVDIFNMSFGTVAPSENAQEDFVRLMKMGTSELRSGRGALYVKAAGNGFNGCRSPHPLNSEIGCLGSNSDPDENLPYLINVGAFSADDVKSSYSSAGANLWVVAPGGEGGIEHPGIITTDQSGVDKGYDLAGGEDPPGGNGIDPDGDYVSTFGGTSSAAPATAGAIAVLLGVNPELTWRDVKHILASSARTIDPDRAEVRAAFNGKPHVVQHAWESNAAGYRYHNWYGFGALALDEAVSMASTHVPGSLGEFVESPWFSAAEGGPLLLAVPDEDGGGVSDTLSVAGLPESADIEAVILEISVDHSYASDLGVTITSPGGTRSVVHAPLNPALDGFPGLRQWQLLSNAFYGEGPNGEWKIQVVDLAPEDTGHLNSWRLRFFYGDHAGE